MEEAAIIEQLILFGLSRQEAVSYTHLSNDANDDLIKMLENADDEGLSNILDQVTPETAQPVSYTHLVQDRWETLSIERQFYVSRCWDTTLAVLDF